MRISGQAVVLEGIQLPDAPQRGDIIIPRDASEVIVSICRLHGSDVEKAAGFVRFILYSVGSPQLNGLSYEQVQGVVRDVVWAIGQEAEVQEYIARREAEYARNREFGISMAS